ncbi:PREDICTED: zinc finger CCHC domain-containing protein 24-like [Papilio xuthus]|uniref:Zinc finger CCHC domain-containing protein 24-like n=1 Tax=Papilio xuthus TaxID=66420 RepID=A0AAJ6ZE35_PAPXU|nr:PREDICTED: zinc finger CCHC domain-containing protein 24-like [Papilio xuthus]
MGCLWSHESSEPERYERRPNYSSGSSQSFRTNTNTINAHTQISCRSQSVVKPKALFGEYKCTACGRSWTSRLSWANTYSLCSRCNKPVYPFNQRELRPSDFVKTPSDNQEHKKDLCQMCQKLGYYCGNYGKNYIKSRK